MEKARRFLLDRRLLGGRAVEDVCVHARRKVSPLGGNVELTHAGGGVATKPRCRISLLLLFRSRQPGFRQPADRLSRIEAERIARRATAFATVQSADAIGCRVGSEWRRL